MLGGGALACESHPHPHPQGPPSTGGAATPVEPPPDAAIEPATPDHPVPGPVTNPAPATSADAEAPIVVPAVASAGPANPCGGLPLGMGRLGTLGHGSGVGTGGGNPCGPRVHAPPAAKLGPIVAKGALDRAIIARVLRRHVNELVYCLEKERIARPSLAGTIQVRFTIDAGGNPGGLDVRGVDATVAACDAAALGRFQYPRPDDGKPVAVTLQITYPPPASR